jgi:hypothetical protein
MPIQQWLFVPSCAHLTMPSYVQLTKEELGRMHLLRLAANDKSGHQKQFQRSQGCRNNNTLTPCFVVDFPETPSPTPHTTPVFQGNTLWLKISTKQTPS